MKFLGVCFLIWVSSLYAGQQIVNDTDRPMLCVANYNTVYAKENIHGIMQNVMTQEQENVIKIIKPNHSFERKREGLIKCYNEKTKIESYNEHTLNRTNEYTQQSYLIWHEMFDIGSYINEDRTFVEKKYGIMQSCKPYDGGEYCQKANGLDLFFDAKGRVSKLFIYGAALQSGQLPLAGNSIEKIRTNGELLGLWVSNNNKRLLQKKPDIETTNALVWNNPVASIQRIVMTSKAGHLMWNRYQKKDDDKLESKLEAIEVDYVLNDALYKKKHIDEAAANAQTWGKYLNPHHIIPKNRFYVAYINTKYPKTIVASETVDKVGIHYVYKDFHDIPSQDFGAYWVGDFQFDKQEKRNISVSLSWAKTRIIVDGKVVYEGGNSREVPYTFSKGTHRIEVEYINNWHTVGFMVNIHEDKKYLDIKELRQKLSKLDADLFYCSVYESKNKDQSISVRIQKHAKPIILLLSSARGVEWQIENPNKVKIAAVIYTERLPGVEVKGIAKSIPLLAYKGSLGSYSMEKRCSCDGALFHCDGENGLRNIERIESVLNKKVYGFSAIYGAQALIVPGTVVTKSWEEKQRELEKRNELIQKKCKKEINPSFEAIFK